MVKSVTKQLEYAAAKMDGMDNHVSMVSREVNTLLQSLAEYYRLFYIHEAK